MDLEQRTELDAFIARCSSGMHLLDLGCHFGVFSLAALHYGGPTARAVAVDPSHTATTMLALHARLNSVADRLSVVEGCAARNDGERGMLDTGVIGAGYFVTADTGRRSADLSYVRAISVDTLCATLDFHPTHLKIDVEGDELDVIRGASILLAPERRPIIFLEIHNVILRSRGQDPRDVVGRLESLGYECHDVSSGRVDSVTFEREVSRLVAEPRPRLTAA